jgi:hypothetical protein
MLPSALVALTGVGLQNQGTHSVLRLKRLLLLLLQLLRLQLRLPPQRSIVRGLWKRKSGISKRG